MQGSGIYRQAGLISKLEGGGGGDDAIQALAALLRYPLNRRLDGSPELGLEIVQTKQPLANAGNRTPFFRSNRKLSTVITRTLEIRLGK